MARSGGRYARTLELLDRSRRYAPDIPTKTGLMVGLGEERDELVATLRGSARRRLRHPDHRPVPAAVSRRTRRWSATTIPTSSRDLKRDRARDGVRARRVGPARAQLVPRARNRRRLRRGRPLTVSDRSQALEDRRSHSARPAAASPETSLSHASGPRSRRRQPALRPRSSSPREPACEYPGARGRTPS